MPNVLKSDLELWLAVRNDNELAFNELFHRYWSRLYKAAQYKLRDKETSSEVVHDIFLSLWQRRHQLEINNFSGYLLMCIRYQVYTRLKPAKAPVSYQAQMEDNTCALTWNKGEINIQEHELHESLQECVSQLPKRCHEIFHLSRIEHLSNQEIAERLGISKKSVENQITMALKHLRTAFEGAGISIILLDFLLRK
ncbi:RNA polymerase sigma factor [Filimonas effusa]|uniref:RNA polymerase sigma-70 factor n=1 Tax=Filimonas effusa TaxID=2508721 RepID=A0A4Q1D4X5_9BACT|nr:RNA polymerase sigma-70 factor [Filimonas effusa]RXK83398.1 RNA polymerase sigma-70 factor [Filimonas effusa]